MVGSSVMENNDNDEFRTSPTTVPRRCRRVPWQKAGIFLLVAVVAGMTVLVIPSVSNAQGGNTSIVRYDCHPDQGVAMDTMKQNCRDRGCTWSDEPIGSASIHCFYPDDYANYDVETVSYFSDDRILIQLNKRRTPSGFIGDIQRVVIEILQLDDNVLRIKFYDADVERWEVPLMINHSFTSKTSASKIYKVTTENSELTVTRIKTGAVIFRTHMKKLIFSDQFIQLTTQVPSKSLYGFGERQGPHYKTVSGMAMNDRIVYTFMNSDKVDARSGYGSHPFYLMYESENTSDAHGILLINSNPSDVTFMTEPALTYRVIGGILDFIIFTGPTALDVMQQKSQVIGRPPMPPYWALGFQLCRWGQRNTSRMRETFFNNTRLGVPIDVQWADIDYMDNFEMFTYDKKNFGGLPDFIRELHGMNRHFGIDIDPSLDFNGTTDAFREGIEEDIFIKDHENQILVTSVWNNKSVIADFTHPQAEDWWTRSLTRFHKDIPFDTLWLDMNEPSANHYYGSIRGCTNNSFDRPQYNPIYPDQLEHHTICMSAKHNLTSHYNLHNVYSLFEGKATYHAMTNIRENKRPYILARSTTTGSSRYTIAHMQGDVRSSYDDMRASIPMMLDFGLFGIPMVGSDICGYYDNTTEELCSRWSSLGSFYTFSRNHNNNATINQDPASMGGNVLEAARKSLNMRYSLLPYLYTLFYHHTLTGAPVVRSLGMNFPTDPESRSNEKQFMWGDGLLVNPVLHPNVTSLDAYFPAGIWYDYQTGRVLSSGKGQNVTLDIPLTDISIALRGGRIFPTIPSINKTTHDHKTMPFTIIVALDENESASGDMYWDDGEQIDAALNRSAHSFIRFKAQNSSLRVKISNNSYTFRNTFREIQILGIRRDVKRVILWTKHGSRRLSHTLVNLRLQIFIPRGTKILRDMTIEWS